MFLFIVSIYLKILMSNMKIGIFIEPPKKKFAYLIRWKKNIKKIFGNQKYLSHPLHTTIAVFDIKKKIGKLKNATFCY
mgnify:CR=1 FL=1